MLMYSNNFAVASNETKSEFVVSFMQQIPILDGNPGVVQGTSTEPVADIVLTGEGAKALADLIYNVLERNA